ncbi:MAG: hypothetical protein FRX48_00176 [Lasallia pustulata]|uniref:Uncharacterized protein n=1 Tax=Lasallia pustulata TaxID=136370 RepID=A0A5M8Q373_9LECA|nr:MAG: hypothetical protein FRX48_00176 [Lasallia pustulata]
MLLQGLKEDFDPGTSDPRSDSTIPERVQGSRDGNTTTRSQTLSRSPLIDSQLRSARDRHRMPKARPSKQLPPSSQKLQKNPYAHALASPLRNCFVTGIRLPDHFHLRTELTLHPETGAPWQLPQDLARSLGDVEKKESSGVSTPSANANAVPLTTTSNPSFKGVSLSHAGAHILAQHHCLSQVSVMKRREYLGSLPKPWKDSFGMEAKRIVWREDMATFVLELLRQKVMKQLAWLVSNSSGYVVRCYGGYKQIADSHQAAAALWLGHARVTAVVPNTAEGVDSNGTASTESEMDLKGSMQPPSPYAMAEYAGRCIPIYNLQTLLGEKHVLNLRESHEIYGGEITVIKDKNATFQWQGA